MLTWWWWDPQLLFSDGFTFRPGPSSKFGFNSFEIQNLTFLVVRVWKLVPLVGAQCSFSALSAVGPCVDPTVDLQWETAGSYKSLLWERPHCLVGPHWLPAATKGTATTVEVEAEPHRGRFCWLHILRPFAQIFGLRTHKYWDQISEAKYWVSKYYWILMDGG